MAGNSFGQLFRITTFGESHGGAVGVVVDGCPPGIEITEEEIQVALDRRRPGQSKITTPRKEADKIQILSGYFEGKTTGTPILLVAYNEDVKSEDYTELMKAYRPSHADYTYEAKYGFRDWRGAAARPRARPCARRRRRNRPEIPQGEARAGNIKFGWIRWATSRRKLTSMTCRWSTSKTTSCAAPTKRPPSR